MTDFQMVPAATIVIGYHFFLHSTLGVFIVISIISLGLSWL